MYPFLPAGTFPALVLGVSLAASVPQPLHATLQGPLGCLAHQPLGASEALCSWILDEALCMLCLSYLGAQYLFLASAEIPGLFVICSVPLVVVAFVYLFLQTRATPHPGVASRLPWSWKVLSHIT